MVVAARKFPTVVVPAIVTISIMLSIAFVTSVVPSATVVRTISVASVYVHVIPPFIITSV